MFALSSNTDGVASGFSEWLDLMREMSCKILDQFDFPADPFTRIESGQYSGYTPAALVDYHYGPEDLVIEYNSDLYFAIEMSISARAIRRSIDEESWENALYDTVSLAQTVMRLEAKKVFGKSFSIGKQTRISRKEFARRGGDAKREAASIRHATWIKIAKTLRDKHPKHSVIRLAQLVRNQLADAGTEPLPKADTISRVIAKKVRI